MDDDQISFFEKDPGLPHPIDITEVNRAVNDCLQQACLLRKLGEGRFHKVYDILDCSQNTLAVVRVARPCMARDKMESEVATMKYLASSGVPVPKIYAWNSGQNATGAEYMIMEKVPGCSAHSMWPTLSLADKKRIVTQVARYLLTAFQARFTHAGSLYLSHSTDTTYDVGPIVSNPFFEVMGGFKLYRPHVFEDIQEFRGPFSNTADWLSHRMRLGIFKLNSADEDEYDADAVAAMSDAVRLCSVYPADIPNTSPHKPFSFRFDDISLEDIMIDETCQITGFIDFECTTIAPLWACATLPIWLSPEDDMDRFTDGSFAEEAILRETFLTQIASLQNGQEWLDAYELGRDLRTFMYRLDPPAVGKHWSFALWILNCCPNPDEYQHLYLNR